MTSHISVLSSDHGHCSQRNVQRDAMQPATPRQVVRRQDTLPECWTSRASRGEQCIVSNGRRLANNCRTARHVKISVCTKYRKYSYSYVLDSIIEHVAMSRSRIRWPFIVCLMWFESLRSVPHPPTHTHTHTHTRARKYIIIQFACLNCVSSSFLW